MLAHIKKALDILACIAIILASIFLAIVTTAVVVRVHNGDSEAIGQGFEVILLVTYIFAGVWIIGLYLGF
jgi:TRAP-type C4-dicarboxylate transport system permease small subunit